MKTLASMALLALFTTACALTGPPPQQESPQDSISAAGPSQIEMKSGYFTMGCDAAGTEWPPPCQERSTPAHRVFVAGFMIDRTEVTQDAYQSVTKSNPSYLKLPNHPVERVTWTEADRYCHQIGKRLPTEAEWEYAARSAGASAGGTYGDLPLIAWYDTTSGTGHHGGGLGHHTVATKQPNSMGINDMIGNVWEWTADWYDLYPDNNGDKPEPKTLKVLRGGSFNNDWTNVTLSVRWPMPPTFSGEQAGFRCAQHK